MNSLGYYVAPASLPSAIDALPTTVIAALEPTAGQLVYDRDLDNVRVYTTNGQRRCHCLYHRTRYHCRLPPRRPPRVVGRPL